MLAVERWNVFTQDPNGGNPLLVFPDGEGLSDSRMQRFALDANLSEVVFLLPGQSKPGAVKARIFNRTSEMVFAGHPVLGAANSVWRGEPEVVIEVPIGQIPVSMTPAAGGVYGEMRQTDPVFGELHDARRIAERLSIPAGSVVKDYPIQTVSTGRPNVILMVDSLRTVRAAKGDGSCYILCRETFGAEADFHARKANVVNEDPATGSAAGAAVAWLVKYGLIDSGKRISIEQGNEAGRPGMLFGSAIAGEAVTDVRIGGYAVRVPRDLGAAVFLDRDGVIIHDREYMRDPADVALMPGAADALRRMVKAGCKLIAVSNQSGVGRGLISPAEMDAVQARMVELLMREGVQLTATYICPHAPEAGCECRKPSPYLLQRAAIEHDVDLSRSWMIGDRLGDLQAGLAAGCRVIWFRNARFPEGANIATRVVGGWGEIAIS